MGVSAVASVIGEGLVADVVGSAVTGAVVSGVMGGDIGMGALTGGIGGGIAGAMGMNPALLGSSGTGTAGAASLGGVGPEGMVYNSATGTFLNPEYFAGATSSMPLYTGAGNLLNQVATGASSLGSNLMSGLSNVVSGGTGTGAAGGQGALGNLANLVRVGSGVYGMMNQGQSPQAAQAMADPYSKYRQQSADQLNQLMQNPNMVYGMPGYNFAQQQAAKQIQRQSAATGTSVSGGTLASLQQQGAQTAQDWFNNYVNILGTQSGANVSPAAGAAAYTGAQKAQGTAQTAALQNIMAGAAGLSSSGFFG